MIYVLFAITFLVNVGISLKVSRLERKSKALHDELMQRLEMETFTLDLTKGNEGR